MAETGNPSGEQRDRQDSSSSRSRRRRRRPRSSAEDRQSNAQETSQEQRRDTRERQDTRDRQDSGSRGSDSSRDRSRARQPRGGDRPARSEEQTSRGGRRSERMEPAPQEQSTKKTEPKADQPHAQPTQVSRSKRVRRRRTGRTLVFVSLAILLSVALWQTMDMSESVEVPYSTFQKTFVATGQVASVEIGEDRLEARLRNPSPAADGQDRLRVSLGPMAVTPDIVDSLAARNIEVRLKPSSNLVNVMAGILPYIAILAIIFLLFRQTQGGQKGVFSFGKSPAKRVTDDVPAITFAEVAGVEEAKQELEEIVEFLREPERFRRLGGRIPKGVLMVGPPGTGKTYLARAVAGEAKVPFFTMSGSDFVEMFVGRRRIQGARFLRPGEAELAVHPVHRRAGRRGPPPWSGSRRRTRRARADTQSAPRGDGRLRQLRLGRHPHRRDEPSRRARSGASPPRPIRSPGRHRPAGRARQGRNPAHSHAFGSAGSGRRLQGTGARYTRPLGAPSCRTWSTKRPFWQRAGTGRPSD